ncbi:MAG: hypothetical protein KBC73_10310 [Burkholderiaceae bacterium]|nr:hypothetical protein [Burkholderiaceae bacterium]
MPIEMPDMPAAVAKALSSGLPRFAVAASPAADNTAAARVARPSITRSGRAISRSIEAAIAQGGTAGVGAPMVVLGLDELAAGKDPRQGRPRLWLQLLPAVEGGHRAMAEVDQQSGKLTAVSEGAEVKALAKRIDALAKPSRSRAAGGARQELGLISVPALHLTALWLKGDAGSADDVVIPSDGPIAPLVPGQRYTLAEFQALCKTMAAERIRKTGDDMGG